MIKSFCILGVFLFLLLFCLSCQEEPTAVQSDRSPQQGSAGLAKGPGGGTAPWCDLAVLTPTVSLPMEGQTADIQYDVVASNDITDAMINIMYDPDKDGLFETLFSDIVYQTKIPCDGRQTELHGVYHWNGRVYPNHSDYIINGEPMVFDQLASDDPDVYLITFMVTAGGLAFSYTVGNPVDDRVSLTPTINPAGFEIQSVVATSAPASSKKGNYVAALKATVTCDKAGFEGRGKWSGLTTYDGCPNCGFKDSDNDGVASTTNTLLVVPGTYTYTVKLIYHPHYSYQPNAITTSEPLPVP